MKFLVPFALLTWFQSCSMINQELGLKDDNVFEEAAEEFIKEETGIEVEFTPHSKDLKKEDTAVEVKNVS